MSFKLSNSAKAEKSIDVWEINIRLVEVLHLIDLFNFVAANTLHSGFISRMFEPLHRREYESCYTSEAISKSIELG